MACTRCNALSRYHIKTLNTGHFSQTHLIKMFNRKKCLVLGFLVLLGVELVIEGKEEEEQTCGLLGKFDINGYVDAKTIHL